MDAFELVSTAALGIDQEAVFINGKVYHIYPPTIRRMIGAVRCLRGGTGETIKDVILSMEPEGMAQALSWLIAGNDSLSDTFMDAPVNEVAQAIVVGLDMLDPRNFIRLSALQRNVRSLIAKPR